jgi:EmrB/QacA subfamily drug resistance transporter
MIANMSLNVALPAMARDLDASTSSLQWMVDAYALVFAGLLFTAGTIGDRFGRKGALQGGLLAFLLGAVMATLAQTAGMVIAARVIMGAAAAFVMPSTLSILTNVFPTHERGRAIGIWAGVAAGGASIGAPTSGFLLEHFWWGSVFLINVPLIALALVAGRRLVPMSRDPSGQPLDIPGALLSILGVGGLVYAIIEGPEHGWGSIPTLTTFGAAAVVLGLFAWRERSTRTPMLDLALFRDRRFSVASGGIALAYFALFGTFFLVAQYTQLVLGYSALEAGLTVLPVSFVMLALAPRVPRFVVRFGAARVVPVGLGLIACGLTILSRLGTDSSVWLVVLALIPLAAGIASTGNPLTTLVMSSVPSRRAGVGSAMNDTSRELGGALGVAALGSLVATQFTSSLGPALAGLPAETRAVANTGLAGALGAARDLPGSAGAALAAAARSAFVDGFGLAVLVAAGMMLVAALGAFILLPRAESVPSTVTAPAIPPAATRPDYAYAGGVFEGMDE